MSLLTHWRMRRDERLCREAHHRIDEIIDAEIPAGRKRRRLEGHIDACLACGADAGTLRELKDAVARVGRKPDPVVRARILELVDEIRAGRATPTDENPSKSPRG